MSLTKGRYTARFARDARDLRAAQALRHVAFHAGDGLDADAFDDRCTHVLIEDHASRALVGCFRFLTLASGQDVPLCYSAQFYDLDRLTRFSGSLVEMGRFCTHPDWRDPDILRVAWGAMTRFVDTHQVGLLFGCASFAGTDPTRYSETFAMLREKHLAPAQWSPGVKAARIHPFSRAPDRVSDAKAAMRDMPSLLRTYMMMGGWVSDHAVIDPCMNTLHVFTGVEITAIPPARKKLLRAVAM